MLRFRSLVTMTPRAWVFGSDASALLSISRPGAATAAVPPASVSVASGAPSRRRFRPSASTSNRSWSSSYRCASHSSPSVLAFVAVMAACGGGPAASISSAAAAAFVAGPPPSHRRPFPAAVAARPRLPCVTSPVPPHSYSSHGIVRPLSSSRSRRSGNRGRPLSLAGRRGGSESGARRSLAGEDDDGGGEMSKPPSPQPPSFRRGDRVLVEVVRFGPLGASCEVLGRGHDERKMIADDEEPLGRGLILQSEIMYFRRGRGGVDVLAGEILPAYVENVREMSDADGGGGIKLDLSLRPPGGGAKTVQLADLILERLHDSESSSIPVGDRSTPGEINEEFPGASKGAFKKAVSALYKRGKVKPGPRSISLM